jgi:uncharacterized protein (TIGR02145 family)
VWGASALFIFASMRAVYYLSKIHYNILTTKTTRLAMNGIIKTAVVVTLLVAVDKMLSTNLTKNLLSSLLVMLLLNACVKETQNAQQAGGSDAAISTTSKILVCHHDAKGISNVINININAWKAHESHGDLRLDDQDHDGYVPDNDCNYGHQGDCDDHNAAVHPGAVEICDNEIDENCNGQVNENCIASVAICEQVWMLKNLDVNHYANGDLIPQAQTSDDWFEAGNAGIGVWGWYNNDSTIGAVYGKLYNWYAVNDPRGLAPIGWHVPTDEEWTQLSTCLGGYIIAGGKLKEAGTTHWLAPNTDATNSSGFTALPGSGVGPVEGAIGYYGYWWSSTRGADFSWFRYMSWDSGFLFPETADPSLGFSVRCLRN